MHTLLLLSLPSRWRGVAPALLAGLALALGAAPADALVTTLLSSEANVSGSLSDADDSWSDSAQSLDLAPSISVGQSFSANTSSNSFVVSSHAVSVGRLRMSTRSTAGAGGATSNGDAAHDFQIRFSIDEAASYELRNGNSTGSFPVASATTSASASLVYELRLEGAPTPAFVYSAPSSGAAGVYRSGTIPAGTYVWSASGTAVANGTPGETQSAAAIGNITLQLDPAPPATVPALHPFGTSALLLALGGLALLHLRRARPRRSGRLLFLAGLAFAVVAPGRADAACPTGFLDVVSGASTLGCIQEDVERSEGTPVQLDWFESADLCFDSYGGRHPSPDEYSIAALNTPLVSPTAPIWTSGVFFSDTAGAERAVTGRFLVGTTIDMGYNDLTNNGFIRCWIPGDQLVVASVPGITRWLLLVFVAALVVSGKRRLDAARTSPGLGSGA